MVTPYHKQILLTPLLLVLYIILYLFTFLQFIQYTWYNIRTLLKSNTIQLLGLSNDLKMACNSASILATMTGKLKLCA